MPIARLFDCKSNHGGVYFVQNSVMYIVLSLYKARVYY